MKHPNTLPPGVSWAVYAAVFFLLPFVSDAAAVPAIVSGTYTPGNSITVEPFSTSFFDQYQTGYVYVATLDREPVIGPPDPTCYDLLFDGSCGGAYGTKSAPEMDYNGTLGARVGTTTWFAWVYYPGTTTSQVLGWVSVYVDGAGTPTIQPPEYGPEDAYIISVSPSWGSTTAGTIVSFSMVYHNNGEYNTVGFNLTSASNAARFHFRPTSTPEIEGFSSVTFPAENLGEPGLWTGYAFMAYQNEYNVADMTTIITEPVYVFASATPEQAAAIVRLSASSTAEVQSMCYGKTGLEGILCKIPEALLDGLSSLFSPHQWSLDLIGSLKTTFGKKPPFGYISVANDQLETLADEADGAFSLEQENNITTVIFEPLGVGISWILYACAGLWIYKRLHHVDV